MHAVLTKGMVEQHKEKVELTLVQAAFENGRYPSEYGDGNKIYHQSRRQRKKLYNYIQDGVLMFSSEAKILRICLQSTRNLKWTWLTTSMSAYINSQEYTCG